VCGVCERECAWECEGGGQSMCVACGNEREVPRQQQASLAAVSGFGLVRCPGMSAGAGLGKKKNGPP
jgi:hypothetical protein